LREAGTEKARKGGSRCDAGRKKAIAFSRDASMASLRLRPCSHTAYYRGLEGVGRRHFGKGIGEKNGGTPKKIKKN